MQLRTLALLCSIVGFLYSGLASALGLGEITLKSQYNQPLNAEIRLLKVRDLSEEEILVALASRDDFRRAGVDRLFFLTGLNYEVVLDNPSNPFIRVTTRKAVTEPYLNFLLEVQWPSGRLLREYTLLLDLPVFTEAAPSSTVVTKPTASTPETVISEPAPTSSSSRYQSSSSRPVVSGPEPLATDTTSTSYSQVPVDSYRVRSGDTLWEIAEDVRSDRSISVHQTMIALQEANPDAFIGGNINRLKNGRVLRVPTADEIANISYNSAVSAVRRQNQDWASQTNNTKAVLTSAAPTTSSSSSLSQPEGRLTLGAADSGQGDVRAAGASSSGESLRNELAAAQDELSRSTRENSELKSRITDLESQIETMEKLVSVTNDQLKALQLATQTSAENITSATEETNLVAEPTTGLDSAVQEQAVEPATEMDSTALSENTEATAGEATATEPATTFEQPTVETPAVASPTVTTPVVTPPAPEETGFDLIGIIKENLLAVGGALAALLVGILVLLRLREKPEVADYGEFDLADEEDVFEGEELDQPDIADELDIDTDEDEDVEAQTEDVVAEADIYVSLGQEDKAIELLQKEIQQNPDNADARLGLLKIYAKAQNATAFDEQYAQLLPLGNVYANDQAMALRKEISDVEPFDTDQYSADSDDAFESLDLGDDLDDLDDELNLDLDLDGDTDSFAGDESEDSFLGSDAEEELSLDTDFDSDIDIGELSLDLNDVGESTDELNLDTDDGSFSLSDLDDDEAFSLDLDDSVDEAPKAPDTSNIVDEMSSDLDKLDIENTNLDDLALDIDSNLDSLGEDLSFASETDDSAAGDLEFDLDFEGADAALEMDESSSDDETDSIADELDLDAPPMEDLDLASLDEEIDAMTAELDDTLPLDKEEPETPDLEETLSLDEDPFGSSDFDMDDIEASVELEESEADDLSEPLAASEDIALDTAASAEEDFAALEESSEEDIDILAKTELDDLVGEADDTEASVEDLASDNVTVSSMMDDASISEDEELDFLEESDEVSTKLDLAKAYIDMGDREGAEDILNEVIEEGNASQKTEAQELMRNI